MVGLENDDSFSGRSHLFKSSLLIDILNLLLLSFCHLDELQSEPSLLCQLTSECGSLRENKHYI